MLIKRSLLAPVICFGLVLGACDSKELTRSRAEKLINANDNFRNVLYQLSVGRNLTGEQSLEAFENSGRPNSGSSVGYGKWYKTLSDDGLIELSWDGLQTGGYNSFHFGLVTTKLTDKGKRYAIGEEQGVDQARDLTGNVFTKGKFVIVKMCEKQVDTITGIQLPQGADRYARVEYQWKFVDRTPFETAAEKVLGVQAICGMKTPQASAANMQLYDDGWRLAQ